MFKFRDESLCIEERVDDLISLLTVEEKISQLTNESAAIERLDIKRYDWWNEALHGVARAGIATVFPQAIALAAMWDEKLLGSIADVISDEARAKYNHAQINQNYERYYGLTFWSPNINIFRDPRWGRGHETYGEDPYLTAVLAKAFINAMQRQKGKHMKTAACAKHLAVHSAPESGRSSFNSQVSKKDLFETYLPAFEVCVKDAHVESVMGAYNALNGVPCCCNEWLLTDLLRGEWGFSGHVVSDCGAIYNISEHHRYTSDFTNAAALSLKSGCDLNCGTVYEKLVDAYEKDLVDEDDIDIALRRLLSSRFKLGMFDEHTEFDDIGIEKVACQEHKEICLKAARDSVVLLKNDGLLPLNRNKKQKIAVIGPNADNKEVLLGNYNGTPTRFHTVLDGLNDFCEVSYAKGCDFFKSDEAELEHAETAAENADVTVLCLGLDASIEGEEGDTNNPYAAGDRVDIDLPIAQQELFNRVCEKCKNVILVMLCGSCFALTEQVKKAGALMQAWYPGELGGKAIAQLIFGEVSPCAKLPVTFYSSNSQLADIGDYSMKNRTYRYLESDPLYPFGYGLSFSEFSFSEPVKTGNTVNLRVKNTGKMDAAEVVQLYIKEKNVPDQPNCSLNRFEKVFLKKGEERVVQFEMSDKDFYHINSDGKKEYLSSDSFEVFVSNSAPCERSKQLGATVFKI